MRVIYLKIPSHDITPIQIYVPRPYPRHTHSVLIPSRRHSSRRDEGTGQFSRLPFSGNSIVDTDLCLGGINITAIEDDINSIDQNPGLLGPEIDMQLGVNYMRYVGDSNFAGVKFGHSAGEHGAWAAGIQYFGYGTIRGADVNGILTGDFSPKDMVFNAMYCP